MIEIVTAVSLWELAKHTGSWIRNLKNAKTARKVESREALRAVVLAAQTTAVYMRQLADTGETDHRTEADLSYRWTDLSYRLDDLKVDKLAKRCRIKGMHWADPEKMDRKYLNKADVGLEKMVQLANELLAEIND